MSPKLKRLSGKESLVAMSPQWAVNNPWENLNEAPPFVLESDKQIIEAHNNNPKTNEDHKIHTELYPEPFLGNPNADVVLLNLNPGFSHDDCRFHKSNEYFIQQARKNLRHKSDYGFYLLDEAINDAPGYKWWNSRLKTLITECGREKVAQNLLCVELFPYHSQRFKRIDHLPSQEYSFYLVSEAIKRKAIIILMRSKKLWIEAIPQLKNYHSYFPSKNPRCAYITERNLPEGIFDKIVKTIKNI